jgi:predicted nicotinamide N-methyase
MQPLSVKTDIGELPLHTYRLRLGGRDWSILHTHAMLTHADEAHFFRELRNRVPYGVALWPAAIALAHDVASRADAIRGRRVLELGAGTGLPGIVAATLGGRVTQTDRHETAMAICKRNGAENGAPPIEYRLTDWADWSDSAQYDWILGSDILYAEPVHPALRAILEQSLAPAGRALIADPFRSASLQLLEMMEADGWQIALSTWSVGEEEAPRTIGIYELARPD